MALYSGIRKNLKILLVEVRNSHGFAYETANNCAGMTEGLE
jgi:hypothetical protein